MDLKCRALNKRSRSHDDVLCESMHVTFWERQIVGPEQISVWQELGKWRV